MRAGWTLSVGWVVVAILAVASLSAADTPERGGPAYQIIVHPANRIEAVDREFLSNAYLKKVATWRNDLTIRPVQLSRRFPQRDQFTREVLRKSPSQLRSYWNRQIFSGKGVPPLELESQEAVISELDTKLAELTGHLVAAPAVAAGEKPQLQNAA